MIVRMKRTQKIKYGVDPHNRLIAAASRKESGISGFRHILDGRFKIGKFNTLSYHLKHPQSSPIPQQLKLSGRWSLDKKHNLVLTLDKKHNQIVKDRLTLKTQVFNAKADKLEFLIISKDHLGRPHLYTLALRGSWQADKYNRLTFSVKRRKDLHEQLTLRGTWEVNRRNQIIYTYTKTSLKKARKFTHTIAFKGYWQIYKLNRLIYVLNKQTGSEFDFKISLGKPDKYGLKYEIGIGARPKRKKFSLFGRWKINKRLGLTFEMPTEGGKVRRLVFGAKLKLQNNAYLEARLKNSFGKDLGIKLKLSKTILKGIGETYLVALKDGKEISLLAGAGLRW